MLESARDSINRLIALYEGERARADASASEVVRLQSELETCRRQITELNRKIDNLLLSGALGPASSSESKARLEKLIREVDKCIRLLES